MPGQDRDHVGVHPDQKFQLGTIAYVEREYDITQSSGEYLETLKTVRIRFVGMTSDLVITRPFENEKGTWPTLPNCSSFYRRPGASLT